MRRIAFTLSEVLIAMSIVGVVAVLTMPSLMNNMYDKTYSSLLQKTYSQLSEAMNEAMAEQKVYGAEDINRYVSTESGREADFLSKYMNVTSGCGSTAGNCFGAGYRTLSGKALRNVDLFTSEYNYYATMKNGVALGLSFPTDTANGSVIVDVNGPKKPNILGKDLFMMSLASNTTMGDFATYSSVSAMKEACQKNTGHGYACFKYLAENDWKIDY